MEKIELNTILFNEIITKEDILRYKTQEEIFSFYMKEDVTSLGLRHSPLRDDNIPSFNLYFHKLHPNTLMFKDYATGDCGDFVILVQKLYGLSYKNALHKIAFDLGLVNMNNIELGKREINYTKITQKEPINLGIKIRPWNFEDKKFWSQFGIHKKTLIFYDVYPISHVFYNDNGVYLNTLAYAYVEFKDGKTTYKIYKPFESREKKWINNTNASVHQGYRQLPKIGEVLVLTKSLKDVMSIKDCLGIPSVGLQSESILIKDSVMEEYKSRFKHVICLFDNDNAGQKLTDKFVEKFNIPFFYMPKVDKVTDFSDCVKVLGKDYTINYTNKIINEIKSK